MLTETDIEKFRSQASDFAESVAGYWYRNGYVTAKQEACVRRDLHKLGWIPLDERQGLVPLPSFDLVASQQAALDKVLDCIALGAPVIALTGAAGTGKSTLTAHVINELVEMDVPLITCATTHPAAAVLRKKGIMAGTIHKAAGLRPHDDGTTGYEIASASTLPRDGVTLIDEASMADQDLIKIVMERIGEDGTLLLIGDASQLPPVAGGLMFDEWVRSVGGPVAELTEVMRSPSAAMQDLLGEYRRDVWTEAVNWPEADVGDFLAYADHDGTLDGFFRRLPEPEEVMLVAYTNREVNALNARGRLAKYGDRALVEPYIVGERLVSNASVMQDDETLIHNGQIVRVLGVRPHDHYRKAYAVMVELEVPIGQQLSRVTVTCAPGLAAETILSDLEAEAKANQEEFNGMVMEAYGHLDAAGEFMHKRRREDLQVLLAEAGADLEERQAVLGMDEERRGAWRRYFEVKNSLADLRPLWARTVHKAQGSETGTVIVLTEGIDSSRNDWRPLVYVAMSRAKQKIILI